MNLIDILAFIQATEDGQGLRIIHGAVQQRQRTLTKEVALRRATEAWDRVKCHKRGDVLYCCAEGTFIGGPLQRGDKMTVYAVQPRKKILWVTVKGNKYSLAFPPWAIARYNLCQHRPENPVPPQEGNLVEGFGKIMEGISL